MSSEPQRFDLNSTAPHEKKINPSEVWNPSIKHNYHSRSNAPDGLAPEELNLDELRDSFVDLGTSVLRTEVTRRIDKYKDDMSKSIYDDAMASGTRMVFNKDIPDPPELTDMLSFMQWLSITHWGSTEGKIEFEKRNGFALVEATEEEEREWDVWMDEIETELWGPLPARS